MSERIKDLAFVMSFIIVFVLFLILMYDYAYPDNAILFRVGRD